MYLMEFSMSPLAKGESVSQFVSRSLEIIDASTLKELSHFLFEQRQEIANQELELAKRHRKLGEEQQLLRRQRDQLTGGSARSVREAVVFVNVPHNDEVKLRVRYLVSQASWTPSYNLRANADRDHVLVEYNASVQQMSGEDWSDVEMTLSTATLSLVAKAPTLTPLAIKLGHPPAANAHEAQTDRSGRPYHQKAELQLQLRSLAERRGQAEAGEALVELFEDSVAYGTASGSQANLPRQRGSESQANGFFGALDDLAEATDQADNQLNLLANELQLMDLTSRERFDQQQEIAENGSSQGVSVSYRLSSRTSLPSRADRQLIQIAAIPMKGDFYRLAIPVLTRHVYEEVRLVNDSQEVLLAGPVSTFVAGQFVGRGNIPTVSAGESFNVGLGIDSSLRTSRELVGKRERIQGGNRVVDFTYQLTIENFNGDPVGVRLLDRLPKAEGTDIKVSMVQTDTEVSNDPSYQMTDHDQGILRWDLDVAPDAAGPDRHVLKYTLQLEYDKQLAIVGLNLRG